MHVEQVSSGRSVEAHARDTALYAVYDALRVGVAVCLENDVVVDANAALLGHLGLDLDEIVGRTFDELLGEGPVITRGASDCRERTLRHRDGRAMWVRVTTSTVEGRDGGALLQVHAVEDLTDLKARERLLQARALKDPVTGLANRYLFEDHLEHALAQRRRTPQPVSVLFVDLDDFKGVNDRFGHAVGDEVLREVGRRAAQIARRSDTVARWAGDEFVVLCPGAGRPEAQRVADRLVAAIAHPYSVTGHTVRLTASVGVAVTDATSAVVAAELVDEADRSMYAVKHSAQPPGRALRVVRP